MFVIAEKYLRHFAAQKSIVILSYELVNFPFKGSTAGGHYVAVCKNPVTRKWHEFNDNA